MVAERRLTNLRRECPEPNRARYVATALATSMTTFVLLGSRVFHAA